MQKTRNQLYGLNSHITTLRYIIGGLILLCLALGFGWDRARQDIRVHIPPDLRQGAVIKPNTPQPYDVYAFVLSIIQVLNHWPTDGALDYPKAIESVKPYLTPRFYNQLKDDLNHRIKQPIENGGISVDELTGRARTLSPVPGHLYEPGKVIPQGGNSWSVSLDLHIDESVLGLNVKTVDVNYPIRVVVYDVDHNLNEWGLALDGYAPPGPSRLAHNEPLPDTQAIASPFATEKKP